MCKQELGLSEKEALDSLKEVIERNVFKKVYINNKCSYCMLKDFVVEDNEDAVRDIEGEKNISNYISSGTEEVTVTKINMGSQTDIMISHREFQDFKAEVQQEIPKLRRDFNYKVNQTFPQKISVFDSSVVLGSDDSNQNGGVNKSNDTIKKSDFK